MLTISTLGSCISEETAKQIATISGGNIKNTTYQWRSDQFCGYIIDKKYQFIEEQYLQKHLVHLFDSTKRYILDLQSKQSIQLFLSSIPQSDIILLDNLTDINIALFDNIHPDHPDSPLQIRYLDKTEVETKFRCTGLISPHKSRINIQQIIDFIHSINNNAHIFFLQYPFNCYDKKGKSKRFQQFTMDTELKGATTIPSVILHEKHMTDHLHYSNFYYKTIAEAVLKSFIHATTYENLNNKPIEDLIEMISRDSPTYSKQYVDALTRDNARLRQELHNSQTTIAALHNELANITSIFRAKGKPAGFSPPR